MKNIINRNVADIRENPEPRSTRINQLLLNMRCNIIEEKGDWLKVESPDKCEGWVRKYYFSQDEKEEELNMKVKKLVVPVYKAGNDKKLFGKLFFDTRIGGRKKGNFLTFKWPGNREKVKVKIDYLEEIEEETELDDMIRISKYFMGSPYLWGGITPFGLDCSGFVQRLYHYIGLDLPRNSIQQRNYGTTLEINKLQQDLDNLKQGDLINFDGHVGLSLGGSVMIHSCSRYNGVVITDLYSGDEYSNHLLDEFISASRVIDVSTPNK